ncbi:methyltransferase [Novosphingobium sp.]|uniref:class I SAM-dependent methyltransferase n=1 Tax=Novosphingobium sp. TaxID=1874826 RepID=UPI0025CD7969|nr:methyltransferase [Novosphingobium sp.]
MSLRKTGLKSVIVLAMLAAGAPAVASAKGLAVMLDAARPAPDKALDTTRHPAEILAFLKIRKGDTVADVWPGDYWDRLFAGAVGPKGKVYAAHLAEADTAEKVTTPPAGSKPLADHPNVVVTVTTANAFTLPGKADVIWIRQSYHDLYDKFMGPSDVPAFNKAVFRALKPGGRFVIVDHTAPAGSKLAATDTTHRIDPEVVKADMAAAGFKFVGESNALRNPADPLTGGVFDAGVKGRTDQFIYVFRRP